MVMGKNNQRNIQTEEFFILKSPKERIKFLLQFAILAPSTHNSQPWLFNIDDSSCEIYYDPKLIIPMADPEQRDLHISIGCAAQNLVSAAKVYGVFDSVSVGPFSNKTHLITICFKNLLKQQETIATKKLLNIQNRINARGLFKEELVPPELLETLRTTADKNNVYISFINEKKGVEEIARLTGKGIKLAYAQKDFRKEMSSWMHNSLTNKKTGLPGYALKMPFMLSFILPTLVRFVNIGKKLAQLNAISIKSAPTVAILSASENTPQSWLRIGVAAEKMMLDVHESGYNTSIFVASIEIGDTYRAVQKIAGIENRPQFIFVIGKIDSRHKPTPRIALEEKIIKTT